MSAGTCPRCGGDGTVVGKYTTEVGHYTIICASCRGTGNVPPTPAPPWVRWWRQVMRRLDDALDRLGAL